MSIPPVCGIEFSENPAAYDAASWLETDIHGVISDIERLGAHDSAADLHRQYMDQIGGGYWDQDGIAAADGTIADVDDMLAAVLAFSAAHS